MVVVYTLLGVLLAMVSFIVGYFWEKRRLKEPLKLKYAVVNSNQDAYNALLKVWKFRGNNKIIQLTDNEYAQMIRNDNRNFAIIQEDVPVD